MDIKGIEPRVQVEVSYQTKQTTQMQCRPVYTSARMPVRISADERLHHLSPTRQEKMFLWLFTMTAWLRGGHEHVGKFL